MNPEQRAIYIAAADALQWRPEHLDRTADLTALFGRSAPLVVDIGCGDGKFLVELAARRSDWNFIGIERQRRRVEGTCKLAVRSGVSNIRVILHENTATLTTLLPPGSIQTAYLLFPDPWPKRHHHVRRQIQDAFMPKLHRALAPDGEFFTKTDDQPYFLWMEKIFARTTGFERLEWDEPADWPKTDFESLFTSRGLPIYRARLRRLG